MWPSINIRGCLSFPQDVHGIATSVRFRVSIIVIKNLVAGDERGEKLLFCRHSDDSGATRLARFLLLGPLFTFASFLSFHRHNYGAMNVCKLLTEKVMHQFCQQTVWATFWVMLFPQKPSGHPGRFLHTRVARWFILIPKISIWIFFGGP
jgi:hypothetical protein